jgi:plasmid stability protein
MTSITISNLSSDIVERLKALAADNGRSLEQEAGERLAAGLTPRHRLLDEIQAKWTEFPPPSAQEVQEWIDFGRRGRA